MRSIWLVPFERLVVRVFLLKGFVMKHLRVKTHMLGTKGGDLIKVTYTSNAKRKKKESFAAFLKRVGTYMTVSAA